MSPVEEHHDADRGTPITLCILEEPLKDVLFRLYTGVAGQIVAVAILFLPLLLPVPLPSRLKVPGKPVHLFVPKQKKDKPLEKPPVANKPRLRNPMRPSPVIYALDQPALKRQPEPEPVIDPLTLEKIIDLHYMNLEFEKDVRQQLLEVFRFAKSSELACMTGKESRKPTMLYRLADGGGWESETLPASWDRNNFFCLYVHDPENWSSLSSLCSGASGPLLAYAAFPVELELEWYAEIRMTAARDYPACKGNVKVTSARIVLDGAAPKKIRVTNIECQHDSPKQAP